MYDVCILNGIVFSGGKRNTYKADLILKLIDMPIYAMTIW